MVGPPWMVNRSDSVGIRGGIELILKDLVQLVQFRRGLPGHGGRLGLLD